MSWGEPGTGEGEFNVVHNLCCDADTRVYVADRENHRVQVFDGNGRFETQWQNLHRPCGLCMPYGHQPIFYVGEVGPAVAVSRSENRYLVNHLHGSDNQNHPLAAVA
jgi:hypothetical protein